MPDQTPLHQITYPLGTDRADIRTLETMARDVDRELVNLHGLNDAEQGKLLAPESGSWTPTFGGGWVIGNGTVKAEYYALGPLVTCRISITAASTAPTTAWGPAGGQSFTLPFPSYSEISHVCGFTTGTTRSILFVGMFANSSVSNVYAGATAGIGGQGIGLGEPRIVAPWSAGSVLYGSFSYRRV